MKHKYILICLFLFLGTLTFAQSTDQKSKEKESSTVKKTQTKAPKLTFETKNLDFGIIVQGSEGTRYFKFKNTGKETLIISQCSGSCGCTVPTCPKEAIPPGKSGKISVHYDTNRVGLFTKNVTVVSNDPAGPIVLTIHGNVTAKP